MTPTGYCRERYLQATVRGSFHCLWHVTRGAADTPKISLFRCKTQVSKDTRPFRSYGFLSLSITRGVVRFEKATHVPCGPSRQWRCCVAATHHYQGDAHYERAPSTYSKAEASITLQTKLGKGLQIKRGCAESRSILHRIQLSLPYCNIACSFLDSFIHSDFRAYPIFKVQARSIE